MVKFLNTTGISYELERIIKEANKEVTLISPYLKVNQRIRELLEDQDRMKIDIRLVYRNRELQVEESNWLGSMSSIRTSLCKSLHAKCYLNEQQALITSMNLYEFSQVNNDEMGLLVSKDEEPDLYDEIYGECRRIIRKSEEVRVTVSKVEPSEDVEKPVSPQPSVRKGSASVAVLPEKGFCLRCKEVIPFNPSLPYCERCYTSWKRYENSDYEEKYCHLCGNNVESTMAKPIGLPCYRKYRSALVKLQ